MFTVIETPTFARLADDYWDEDDRAAFVAYIAGNPDAGAVVPGSGGIRKVRWSRQGSGKRGGVRVLYFNRLKDGEIWLLLIYGKGVKDNIPAHILRLLRQEIEDV
jgi:hypothetical protein